MKKKESRKKYYLIAGIVILVITSIFCIMYIFFGGYFGNSAQNSMTYCQSNSDCILVFDVSNCCRNGCPTNAINKNYLNRYEKGFEDMCRNETGPCPSPTGENCSQSYRVFCFNNTCSALIID